MDVRACLVLRVGCCHKNVQLFKKTGLPFSMANHLQVVGRSLGTAPPHLDPKCLGDGGGCSCSALLHEPCLFLWRQSRRCLHHLFSPRCLLSLTRNETQRQAHGSETRQKSQQQAKSARSTVFNHTTIWGLCCRSAIPERAGRRFLSFQPLYTLS